MGTMKINANFCKSFRKEIEEVLSALEKKHNLKFRVGNMRYTSSTVSIKLDAAVVSEDGVVETPEFRALKVIHPELVNKTVSVGGESMKIIGYKPRSPRYPFIGETVDGRRFKLTEVSVLR
jgi:hypothetical protein